MGRIANYLSRRMLRYIGVAKTRLQQSNVDRVEQASGASHSIFMSPFATSATSPNAGSCTRFQQGALRPLLHLTHSYIPTIMRLHVAWEK